MSTPSPFEIGREISTNVFNAYSRVKDENAIENILSQAMSTGDPQVIQNSIGKILSQVSPERQAPAIQYLQNTYANIQKKQEESKAQKAAAKYGVDPHLPPTVQAAIIKENQKNKRISSANTQFNGINSPSTIPASSIDSQAQQAPEVNEEGIQPSAPAPNPALDSKSKKQQLLALTGHPDREISERAKAELRNLEADEREDRADLREKRKETQKIREEFANRGAIAQQGIQEKEHLINLIDTGKIDDPTYAVVLDAIPMKLGQRFLSNETVQYKAGLVNGYRDLRNIFSGTTRVKEIELLEDKVADLYLTDEQKKAILKSSLQSLQYDVIRAQAAAEVEKDYPDLGILQFNKKVDEKAKPRINALANRIIDEQKSYIVDAENRKKIPLDYEDPEGRQILEQILKEAGGDRNKARQIAKKKGYTIGK